MKKALFSVLAFLAALSVASAADLVLRQDFPAKDWESQYFPIGNGSLGAMLNGGIAEDILQLNLDSLWSGDGNPPKNPNPDANYAEMGCYLPLGVLMWYLMSDLVASVMACLRSSPGNRRRTAASMS